MGIVDRVIDGAVRIGAGVVTRVMASSAMESRRAKKLTAYEQLYRGQQYEGRGLGTPWDKVAPNAKRTPLRQQKPSVQYDLPRIIVDRPTALLFGEGRAPEITFDPQTPESKAGETDGTAAAITKWFADIAEEGGLAPELLTWSRQGGSQGSACLTWAIVDGEFEFQSHKAQFCAPTFHPRKRRRLVKLEKRYRVTRPVQSIEAGVVIVRDVEFWHREEWDETRHVVFAEVEVGDGKEPSWKEADVAVHNFGFVPAAWAKNLDDGEPSSPDGISLLDGLEDIVEDIDRTLSQKSRAVRYNQDPETIYFGLTEEQRKRLDVGGNASTALGKKTEGAAVEKLELKGEGQTVAEAHIMAQRGRGLETSRVTVPDPDKVLAAARSGAAIRMLFAVTLELVGELRMSYGRALKEIFSQILRAVREGKLAALGSLETPPPASIPKGKVKLVWGRFFDQSAEDIDQIARAAAAMKQAGLLDRETLVRWLANFLGLKDIAAILNRLEQDDEKAAEALAPLRSAGDPGAPPAAGSVESDDDETEADGDGPPAN